MSIKSSRRTRTNILFTKNMKICNEGYTLTHKIGYGNFGEVFLGMKSQKKQNSYHMVAIKIEKQMPGKSVSLLNQIQILKAIKRYPQSIGFPQIYEHGFQKGNHFAVMELLGPNLNDLMKMCGGKFSLSTTVVLGLQIIERIQFLHSIGIVCRDIKPQNFLMGLNSKSSMLYMIDFGLSKRYRDPRVNLHIPYRQQRDFSGTLRYSSICSHLRIQNARRDDLQSICYMLIYFLEGNLPWQSNHHQSSQIKQRLILQKKMKISPAELCSHIPQQFKNILQYCIQLDYYEEPDYQFIHAELLELYDKLLAGQQFSYDWALQINQKKIEKEDVTLKITPHDLMKDFCLEQSQKKLNGPNKDQDSQFDSDSDIN